MKKDIKKRHFRKKDNSCPFLFRGSPDTSHDLLDDNSDDEEVEMETENKVDAAASDHPGAPAHSRSSSSRPRGVRRNIRLQRKILHQVCIQIQRCYPTNTQTLSRETSSLTLILTTTTRHFN